MIPAKKAGYMRDKTGLIGKNGVYIIEDGEVKILGKTEQIKNRTGRTPISDKFIKTIKELIEKNQKEIKSDD